MEIPIQIKEKLSNLTVDEAIEIETFFANLPEQDPEVEALIKANIDDLVSILSDWELISENAFGTPAIAFN